MRLSDTFRPFRPATNLLRGKPVLAIFEVCLRCNSACGYCDLPLNEGRYELSRDEIKRIFTGLYRDGIRHLFIQGGEPFVRKDCIDILENLDAIGYRMTVITNGTRFTPELVARLSKLRINISVSLDSLDRERYKEIRGADQLHLVLCGIELLRDFPGAKHMACIVSELNRHEIVDVVRFATDNGFVPVVGAYHWNVHAYGKETKALRYERAAAVETFKHLVESELVPAGFYRDYLKENVRWLSGEALAECDAGRYSIAIDASGNVAPCLAHAKAGNLRDKSLGEILAGMDMATVRECSDRSSCNLLCSRVVGAALSKPVTGLKTLVMVR